MEDDEVKGAAAQMLQQRFMAEIRKMLVILQAEFRLIREEFTTLVANLKVATNEWLNVKEFSRLVEKSDFTVRQWCNHKRIHAAKNAQDNWVISRDELKRYRREGLLPPIDPYRHIR